MNPNKTDIVLVLDRSGSMVSIRKDTEGGLKTYIESQAKEKGDRRISLYQFDTLYETVFEDLAAKDVPAIEIVPRGGTALYDAVGRTIAAVGSRLAATPEAQRPANVIVVVITDGEENSSKEFTQNQIKTMVEHQSGVYNWRFVYLGANQDAVLNGTKMGFVSNYSMGYGTTTRSNVNMYGRLERLTDLMVEGAICGFTDEDRQAVADHTLPQQTKVVSTAP